MTMQVAAYVRVSTDEQAEQGISIAAQTNRIAAYCEAQGWRVQDVYCDDGWSGKNLERPAVRRLIEGARQKKFDAVAVIKLDRLSRRQKDILYLLEDILEPNGVGFKSVTESFDTTTPFGKAAVGMMAVFAQLERETIVERIKIAKKEAARQGLYMGGPLPYGYRYDRAGKRVEVNEASAETVRWIFQAYLNSARGYQAIADALNERRIPASGNSREGWQRQTVRVILHNPFYAGYIQHKGDLHEGKHAAIISREDFFAAQKLQKSRSSYRADAPARLLTGRLYCAECGARMRLKKSRQSPKTPAQIQYYYVCYSQDGSSRSMIKDPACKCGYKRAEDLESSIVRALFARAIDTRRLKETAARLLSANRGAAAESPKAKLEREHAAIQSRLEKWYNAFEIGAIEAGELSRRVRELQDLRSGLAARIKEADAARPGKTQIAFEQVAPFLNDIQQIWKEASPDEQREILCGFISKVHVRKNNQLKIEFY